MAFHPAGKMSELWSGEMLGLQVAGRKVLLVKLDGKLYAYADRCAHLGVPLSEGELRGAVLTCRAHHWEYDLCAGKGCNPASARLEAFAVRVVEDQILVELEEEEGGSHGH